ncbi:outer membrane beta-barrel protein [Cardinium endosymbiont of Culicoides punctatus]|uniref:outer membrane beta-barrel protein n=1 Tax=Cardinium endosymbiont of Culicoides punctatus TaxID=2304601 RepID=UPI001058C976|nr:outer membrane beta-barrel protein [Cardinium endosymbiont of Culicoides punctatus]TDG95449.1 hypothetical protein CCPUN_03440 [Cardinium endosymbiont of Culicoides punctatus]
MKNKVVALLLIFFANHAIVDVVHATAYRNVGESPATISDQENLPMSDAYVPPIENYFSCTSELLGMDYLLHQGSSAPIPVKKFDFSGLFRHNIAFLYAIRINQSRFAFCPGVGFSSLKYYFDHMANSSGKKIYKTLTRVGEKRTECKQIDETQLIGNDGEVTGSQFNISYFDVMFRVRFNSVLDEPKEGFHVWLGMKLGFRIGATTTIDYSEYNETGASLVRSGSFNLSRAHLSWQGGLGYSRFGLIVTHGLSSLFDENRGPDNAIRPLSVGLYIDLL